MRLIVDANIIISALIKESVTRSILIESSVEFYTVEYTFDEIKKHLGYISEKNSLTIDKNKKVLDILSNYIHIFEAKYYIDYLNEAQKIIGKIDERDVPYIALALAINNDGIWSNDKHFEKQDEIRIWKTKDIIKTLKK